MSSNQEDRLKQRAESLTDSSAESDDDQEQMEKETPTPNTAEMTWPQYLWHGSKVAGTKSLAVCDYLGEKLAWFFGITTPRYGYVVEEWERMKLEEELEKKTLEKLKKQAEEKRAQRLAQMEGQVL